MRELTQRVDEVRQWKEELIKARRTTIELTTHRVEEKRQYLLLLRAKKRMMKISKVKRSLSSTPYNKKIVDKC